MSSIPFQDRNETDEITLVEMCATIWAERFTVIIITLVAAIIAAIYSLMMTPQFESTVLLSPVSDEEGGSRLGGASALLSQFGGLSALGGLNFSSSNRKAEAVATLMSRALTRTYIEEKNLMPILFEGQWDKDAKRWKSDDPKKQPTLWQAEGMFMNNVEKVAEDKKIGLLTLKITWKDPVLASTWANDLVQRTNSYLRQKSIDQSNRNIAYLNDQLNRTSVVELQKAIYALVESEIKKVMIAQGSDEFAFKVIDPAVVAERKSKPKRALIVAVGGMIGFIFAALFVLLRRTVRDQ